MPPGNVSLSWASYAVILLSVHVDAVFMECRRSILSCAVLIAAILSCTRTFRKTEVDEDVSIHFKYTESFFRPNKRAHACGYRAVI